MLEQVRRRARTKIKSTNFTTSTSAFLKKDIDVLANKVHSVITESYEAACPMQNSLRKNDNIWWNSELATLWKKARRAWRKAIKTKQEKD